LLLLLPGCQLSCDDGYKLQRVTGGTPPLVCTKNPLVPTTRLCLAQQRAHQIFHLKFTRFHPHSVCAIFLSLSTAVQDLSTHHTFAQAAPFSGAPAQFHLHEQQYPRKLHHVLLGTGRHLRIVFQSCSGARTATLHVPRSPQTFSKAYCWAPPLASPTFSLSKKCPRVLSGHHVVSAAELPEMTLPLSCA